MKNREISRVAVTGNIPVALVEEAIVGLAGKIIDCYKSVKIAEEEQETERLRIREQARVCILAIESNTKKFEISLELNRTERARLIDQLCEVIGRESLDSMTLQFCKLVLDYLSNNNPMKYVEN